MPAALPHLVEDLFRHRYGALVARLCRVLGAERLDLAEDVVQEALLSALRTWPADGVPVEPEAWVFRVARNRALDVLRRSKVAARVERELQAFAQEQAPEGPPPDVIADDTLRMMFTCCHPAVPPDSRVPLVLKTVAGFGVPEIAGALLQKEGTIGQRLSRAKARLQQEQVRFEVPPPQELNARLPPVLDALYLMFNEGWRSHRGAELLRPDLVHEALRLCGLLLENAPTRRPEVHALLALMLLLGARLPARTDALGDLLTLAEQDRSRWDREWLQCGFLHFQHSLNGPVMSPFHVEAAIASIHAVACNYAATDWPAILREYDRLLAAHDSPVVRLNRVVALAKVHGARAALQELEGLRNALDDYGLLHATRAQLCWELGEHEAAADALEHALSLPSSQPEQRLLRRRLEACRRREHSPAW